MNRLALFARQPEAGQVKTRLSPALPKSLALQLHIAMVEDAMDVAMDSGVDSAVFWSPPRSDSALPSRVGLEVRWQQGADLGGRLSAAFDDLRIGEGNRVVVIGADCPDLTPGVIRDAFAALDGHDLVLGPARDGGYYLIGLRRAVPELFQGIAWGTDRVMAGTLERADAAGVTVARLGDLDDIDTPDDLVRFIARRLGAPPGPGARTEAALAGMGLLPPRA